MKMWKYCANTACREHRQKIHTKRIVCSDCKCTLLECYNDCNDEIVASWQELEHVATRYACRQVDFTRLEVLRFIELRDGYPTEHANEQYL
jgi:hypothetical protein